MFVTRHFRKTFNRRHGKSVKSFEPDVTRKLFAYDWPGNVRQLRNTVETMIVLDSDGLLGVDDLPPELMDVEEPASVDVSGPVGLVGHPMDAWEKCAIEETLKLTNGNREETARVLGIGARTLYRKLKSYGLR